MATMFSLKMVGAGDMIARLKAINEKMAKKVVKDAARAAAKLLAAVEKEYVPVGDTGLLKKSIGQKVAGRQGTGLAVVGPRSNRRIAVGFFAKGKRKGAVKYHWATKIAHFAEKGTRRSRGTHFIGRTVSSATPTALRLVEAVLKAGLEAAG